MHQTISNEGQGNGWDTNNNANDFVVTSSVNPQNASSTAEPASASADDDNMGLGI